MNKHHIHFIYPGTVSYAGQTDACEHAIVDIRSAGWTVIPNEFPAFNRSRIKNRIGAIVVVAAYILSLSTAMLKVCRTVFNRHPTLIISHCQPLGALLRMGIPHLIVATLRPDAHIGVVLHGTLFMSWERTTFRHRFFMRLIRSSKLVTVSSKSQKDKLVADGAMAERILVLHNTTTVQPVTPDDIRAKAEHTSKNRLVRVLFLSTLLDVKGFMEYLEGMELLAQRNRDFRLEITLCGPVAFSAFCSRFSSPIEKEQWVKNMVEKLNDHAGVTCRWLTGANGADKDALYHNADIFVLPSTHPIESQPLVLAEAMATGCAIVTSRAGSIDEVVNDQCAVFLDSVSPQDIEQAVHALAIAPEQRIQLALSGLTRFNERHHRGRHRQFWADAANRLTKDVQRDPLLQDEV